MSKKNKRDPTPQEIANAEDFVRSVFEGCLDHRPLSDELIKITALKVAKSVILS